MRVLYVNGLGDYGAWEFENSVYSPEKLWGLWTNGKQEQINEIAKELKLEFKFYEFEDVDGKFVSFIKEKVQDYESSKHANFYVIS